MPETYDLEVRLLQFSAAILRFEERIPKTRSGNLVASQLIRCGT